MDGSGFAASTAIEPVGDGLYAAQVDATWGVFGNANGGYLLAIMARAAMHAGARAFPVLGPLAVAASAGEIRDGWFDESMVVADLDGRLIVRARQLARLPRPT